jgi:hypothetical protein
MRPDTDGDGIPDRIEFDFGFLPTRTDSPDRSILVWLDEAPNRSVRLAVSHVVVGEGHTFTGAFRPLPAASEEDASTFYRASFAFAAIPRENVFEIFPELQRFAGVTGRTELVYEVFFETPQSYELQGCRRAYPWRYDVKRNDGSLVLARRYLLIVGPEGTSEWCVPPGPCI